ncbi:MAG: Gfo/Idh/MocA family oxidoreductase [Saprospiraceae bacterium]|nr:Gfo/Idh/MocA family oxidoreductase [Saprospiraceae bacterium]
MKPLKGVAVGAGFFSQFHFEAWTRIPEADLVAICDLDLRKAQQTAQYYGIPRFYDDVKVMLDEEQPDFIDIITPPAFHLLICQEAMARGIAIICQKPLVPTLEEAEQLLAAAKAAGVPFMVHENFRFQPWFREIRSLLDKGWVGDRLHSIYFRMRTGDGWPEDAYSARQPYFRTMPRLLIYETGIHYVDVFRYLFGEITSVFAHLRKLNPAIAGEDCAMVFFQFANGANGVLDGNRFNEADAEDPRYTFGELLLEGNGGSIRLDMEGRISIQPLGKDSFEHEYVHQKRNFAGDCVYATQRHFVESLLKGKSFETNLEDYLHNVRVQEAIYSSSAQGKLLNP